MGVRGLVRELCIHLGLLQSGDSRDIIVDILHLFIRTRKEYQSLEVVSEVIKVLKSNKRDLKGIADSNVRRQLSRLVKIGILERTHRRYYLPRNLNLCQVFDQKVQPNFFVPLIYKIQGVLKQLDSDTK